MIGYSQQEVFSMNDLTWMRHAQHIVAQLPEHPQVRCHEVARVVAMLCFGVEVVDGKFGAVEHSWLLTRDKAILDCYAVGSLPMVQLVDPHIPGGTPYTPGEKRTDIRTEVLQHLRGEI